MNNIVLIQFSSRKHGNCANIIKKIQNYYDNKQTSVYIVDANTVQPCSNCNYECLTPGKKCPNLSQQLSTVLDAICRADLAYFVVPNYCGYPCANYFAFNERSVGYFNMDRSLSEKYMSIPKRFIIVSNTEGGNFEKAMHQQTKNDPEILYLKTRKYGKNSISGDMMESDDAQLDLEIFLAKNTSI